MQSEEIDESGNGDKYFKIEIAVYVQNLNDESKKRVMSSLENKKIVTKIQTQFRRLTTVYDWKIIATSCMLIFACNCIKINWKYWLDIC